MSEDEGDIEEGILMIRERWWLKHLKEDEEILNNRKKVALIR